MNPAGSRREGSALVVSLMLVALMLTLVLYYVSLLRLETRVSGYMTADGLSRMALERALAEAAEELMRAFPDGQAYPPPTASVGRVSRGSGGAVGNVLPESLAEDQGWPAVFRGSGSGSLRARLADAQWVVEGDTGGVHTATAWLGVNLTGLLDPHGVADLDTTDLGYVRGPLDDTVYFTARELEKAVPGLTPVFLPGGVSRDRGWFDSSAFTWNTTRIVGGETISMHPREWTEAQTDAVFAFLYPDRDHGAIAEAFRDFRDGAPVPVNPDGITAVPVPMFNEVSAVMSLENLGDRVQVVHQLDLEIWRPFPGNVDTNRYQVARTPALSAGNAGSEPLEQVAVDVSDDWTFPSPNGEVEDAFAFLTLNVTNTVVLVEGAPVEVAWELAGLEVELLEGAVVDRLPAGLRVELPPVSVPPSGSVVEASAFLAVTDPRLNHEADEWNAAAAPSIGAINPEAGAFPDPDRLLDTFACWAPVGRAPDWEEAWVGFLPLDEPWRSVDLFSDEGRWWLKHTRTPDWEAGRWVRHRVNPSSGFPEALEPVFRGVPLREWPDQSGASVLTPEVAERLALDLNALFLLDEGATDRGDWAAGLEATLVREEGLSLHQAEAVIGETLDRLTTDCHLWGVVGVAESRDASGRVRHRRGVLTVWWMDPFPSGAEGRHAWRTLARYAFPLQP